MAGTITLDEPRAAGGHGAAVEVSTAQVRRGRTTLDLTVTGTTETGGAIVTNRGSVVEFAQPIAGGAEQSWCFQRTPAGPGDLVVRINVAVKTKRTGSVPVAPVTRPETAPGAVGGGVVLHSEGALDLTYQDGIWLDTNGHRWPVPARWVGGAIELTVPANVLDASSFPATLDPGIMVTPG